MPIQCPSGLMKSTRGILYLICRYLNLHVAIACGFFICVIPQVGFYNRCSLYRNWTMAIQCVSGSMEFSTRNSIFYLSLNLRIGIAAVRPISVVAPRVPLISVRVTGCRMSQFNAHLGRRDSSRGVPYLLYRRTRIINCVVLASWKRWNCHGALVTPGIFNAFAMTSNCTIGIP